MLRTEGNRLFAVGVMGLPQLRRLLATLYKLQEQGYKEIILDFGACTAAFAAPILGLCSRVMALQKEGFSFQLLLPEDKNLVRLFENANWAHFLDPKNFYSSLYSGRDHVAAIRFSTSQEQHDAVNKLVDAILRTVTKIERSDLAAMEWALNEVMDNVLLHASSSIGGIVQLSRLSQKRLIEIVVADAGIGIPKSLRATYPQLSDDIALEKAIQEGVTRDSNLGQGNGLFGTYRIARESKGFMHIHSGYGSLDLQEGYTTIEKEDIPVNGTLLSIGLNYTQSSVLGQALQFRGKRHEPVDIIQTEYEPETGDVITIRVSGEVVSFGSRLSATPLRIKIENLHRMTPEYRIAIDFTGISLVSSSFADELIGKLFIRLGPTAFMNALRLVNTTPLVRELIDRAILQRSATLFPANGH